MLFYRTLLVLLVEGEDALLLQLLHHLVQLLVVLRLVHHVHELVVPVLALVVVRVDEDLHRLLVVPVQLHGHVEVLRLLHLEPDLVVRQEVQHEVLLDELPVLLVEQVEQLAPHLLHLLLAVLLVVHVLVAHALLLLLLVALLLLVLLLLRHVRLDHVEELVHLVVPLPVLQVLVHEVLEEAVLRDGLEHAAAVPDGLELPLLQLHVDVVVVPAPDHDHVGQREHHGPLELLRLVLRQLLEDLHDVVQLLRVQGDEHAEQLVALAVQLLVVGLVLVEHLVAQAELVLLEQLELVGLPAQDVDPLHLLVHLLDPLVLHLHVLLAPVLLELDVLLVGDDVNLWWKYNSPSWCFFLLDNMFLW